MNISQQESSSEVAIYDFKDQLQIIDTPGLFGFKEKTNASTEQIEKYKDITKRYVSNALCSRSHDQSVFVGLFANKWLWCDRTVHAAAACGGLRAVPQHAFGTVPLILGAWVECLGLAMIVLVASELRKCVLRALRK